jgi:endonuclease/exonuclease/phosphatase family metal-dependent hydrolase
VALASPLGQINIERGFAVVDAQTPTGAIRFVNTHLEIPELPLTVQAAQAAELVVRLDALPNPSDLPVIIAGDINSAPTDIPVVVNGLTIVPPYLQFAAAGYADAWNLRPGASTG